MDQVTIARTTPTDAELAGLGDRAAFTRLVATHHRPMERVAYVICGDLQTAADAVQSAWLIAWQRLPGLRDHSKVSGWLIAIAGNEARKSIRRRRRSSVRELELAPEVVDPTAKPPTDAAIERIDLLRALDRLSAEDRQLLALRYVAGIGSEELGQLTGRSASGIRGRLSRINARLRKDLTGA